MHKEIEVYVDDMFAKSKSLEQHIEDLRKLFARLCKYKLGLNPAKCTFGVKTRKLLGFVVSERGIEVDLNKVKAIREMPTPRTDSEPRVIQCSNFFVRRKDSNGTRNAKRLSRKSNGTWRIPGPCPDSSGKNPNSLPCVV
ncbi:Retrovirus-related Pol polyprotein from transposon opus, partial [Mucuna pruriens]